MRRPALHLTVVVVVLLGGCLGLGAPRDTGSTVDRSPITSVATPAQPTATETGVLVDYVERYENTTFYNGLVGPTFARAETSCTATLVERTPAGSYLRAACSGAAYYDIDGDGTAAEHEDVAQRPVEYVVTDQRTVRITPEVGHVFVPSQAGESTERRLTTPTLTVLNAANDSVNVSVGLVTSEAPTTTTTNTTAFQTTHDLASHSGVVDQHLVTESGTYDLVVTVGERTVRASWPIDEGGPSRTVVVWPDGTVTVEPRPSPDDWR